MAPPLPEIVATIPPQDNNGVGWQCPNTSQVNNNDDTMGGARRKNVMVTKQQRRMLLPEGCGKPQPSGNNICLG